MANTKHLEMNQAVLSHRYFGGNDEDEAAAIALAIENGARAGGAGGGGTASLPHMRGITLPEGGANAFRHSTRDRRHIVFYGESNVANAEGMVTQYRQILRNEYGADAVHVGFQGIWAPDVPDSGTWTQAGTWIDSETDAALAVPHAAVMGRALAKGVGSAAVATWTRKPVNQVNEVVIVYVDHGPTMAGSAAPSYSVDGGNTWIDLEVTRPAQALLRREVIAGLNNPATVRVRGASSDGTSSTIHLMGIESYGPQGGIAAHNMGMGASILTNSMLYGFLQERGWYQWFDHIEPETVFMLWSNDTLPGTNEAGRHIAMINALDRLFGLGSDVVWLHTMAQQGRTDQARATYREHLADALGVMVESMEGIEVPDLPLGYIDIEARWGTFEEATAKGLMEDTVHASLQGYRDMAAMVDRYMRIA